MKNILGMQEQILIKIFFTAFKLFRSTKFRVLHWRVIVFWFSDSQMALDGYETWCSYAKYVNYASFSGLFIVQYKAISFRILAFEQ